MSGIVIVDYGLANLRSVQKAFERFGHGALISARPEDVEKADKVVLPGVGAFRDAISRVRETHLDAPILKHINSGRPFFGICLGFQLLFDVSHEDGHYEGLGLFHGEVVRFPETPGLKVPHMGWNQLRVRQRPHPLASTPDGASVYFVHSYYPVPKDQSLIATETEYPTPFCSAIATGRLVATQFHPEKSQAVGLEMLRNFAEW
jgi:glutamine amidotransferase